MVKQIIKKIYFILTTLIIFTIGKYCQAGLSIVTNQYSGFYYDYNAGGQTQLNTNIGNLIKEEIIENDQNLNVFQQLLNTFQLKNQPWFGENSEKGKAVYYAKWIINMILSLTALISLVMIIFAFYMIFFQKDDAGITKAKQVLKGTILALFVIGISRFIVSIFFWVERGVTKENGGSTMNGDTFIEVSYLNKNLNQNL